MDHDPINWYPEPVPIGFSTPTISVPPSSAHFYPPPPPQFAHPSYPTYPPHPPPAPHPFPAAVVQDIFSQLAAMQQTIADYGNNCKEAFRRSQDRLSQMSNRPTPPSPPRFTSSACATQSTHPLDTSDSAAIIHPSSPHPTNSHPNRPISLCHKQLRGFRHRVALAAKSRVVKKIRKPDMLFGVVKYLRSKMNRAHGLWAINAHHDDAFSKFMEDICQLFMGPETLTSTSNQPAANPSPSPLTPDFPEQQDVIFFVAATEEVSLASPIAPHNEAVVPNTTTTGADVTSSSKLDRELASLTTVPTFQSPISSVVSQPQLTDRPTHLEDLINSSGIRQTAPMIEADPKLLQLGSLPDSTIAPSDTGWSVETSLSATTTIGTTFGGTSQSHSLQCSRCVEISSCGNAYLDSEVAPTHDSSVDGTMRQQLTVPDAFCKHEFGLVSRFCMLGTFPIILPCFDPIIIAIGFLTNCIDDDIFCIGDTYANLASPTNARNALFPTGKEGLKLSNEMVICSAATHSEFWPELFRWSRFYYCATEPLICHGEVLDTIDIISPPSLITLTFNFQDVRRLVFQFCSCAMDLNLSADLEVSHSEFRTSGILLANVGSLSINEIHVALLGDFGLLHDKGHVLEDRENTVLVPHFHRFLLDEEYFFQVLVPNFRLQAHLCCPSLVDSYASLASSLFEFYKHVKHKTIDFEHQLRICHFGISKLMVPHEVAIFKVSLLIGVGIVTVVLSISHASDFQIYQLGAPFPTYGHFEVLNSGKSCLAFPRYLLISTTSSRMLVLAFLGDMEIGHPDTLVLALRIGDQLVSYPHMVSLRIEPVFIPQSLSIAAAIEFLSLGSLGAALIALYAWITVLSCLSYSWQNVSTLIAINTGNCQTIMIPRPQHCSTADFLEFDSEFPSSRYTYGQVVSLTNISLHSVLQPRNMSIMAGQSLLFLLPPPAHAIHQSQIPIFLHMAAIYSLRPLWTYILSVDEHILMGVYDVAFTVALTYITDLTSRYPTLWGHPLLNCDIPPQIEWTFIKMCSTTQSVLPMFYQGAETQSKVDKLMEPSGATKTYGMKLKVRMFDDMLPGLHCFVHKLAAMMHSSSRLARYAAQSASFQNVQVEEYIASTSRHRALQIIAIVVSLEVRTGIFTTILQQKDGSIANRMCNPRSEFSVCKCMLLIQGNITNMCHPVYKANMICVSHQRYEIFMRSQSFKELQVSLFNQPMEDLLAGMIKAWDASGTSSTEVFWSPNPVTFVRPEDMPYFKGGGMLRPFYSDLLLLWATYIVDYLLMLGFTIRIRVDPNIVIG